MIISISTKIIKMTKLTLDFKIYLRLIQKISFYLLMKIIFLSLIK